jgi:hypothetical protein
MLGKKGRLGVASVIVVLIASVAVSACGGGGASQEEIARAEKHGRQYRAEKEKERRLEREIDELKKERQREKKQEQKQRRTPTTPSATAQVAAPESERTSCGGSLEVGPDTTCGFAENVRAEYEYEIGTGPGTVLAYSEANDELYEMNCTAAPHECTGAISASVYFP